MHLKTLKNRFFTATEHSISPNLHSIAILEITYWLPNNMTLLHNGMHIGRQ